MRELEDQYLSAKRQKEDIQAKLLVLQEGWPEFVALCSRVPGDEEMGWKHDLERKRNEIDELFRAATGSAPKDEPLPHPENSVDEHDSEAQMPCDRLRLPYRRLVTKRRKAEEAASLRLAALDREMAETKERLEIRNA